MVSLALALVLPALSINLAWKIFVPSVVVPPRVLRSTAWPTALKVTGALQVVPLPENWIVSIPLPLPSEPATLNVTLSEVV